MIYIICATKSEAQAFVERYKLDKSKKNDTVTLIVSGVGSENIYKTLNQLIPKISSDDILLNVGICAASKKYKIGTLIDASQTKVTTLDVAATDSKNNSYDIVDMELKGFLDATKHVKNRYAFKVVSDHFQPEKVTKDETKKLIFSVIDDIMQKISTKSHKLI